MIVTWLIIAPICRPASADQVHTFVLVRNAKNPTTHMSIETVKVPDAGTTTASGIEPELGAAALTTSEMASVAVSLKEKLVAGTRVLLSQTPFHDPAQEPLPEFADRWFDRYDSGGDVVLWYGGS